MTKAKEPEEKGADGGAITADNIGLGEEPKVIGGDGPAGGEYIVNGIKVNAHGEPIDGKKK